MNFFYDDGGRAKAGYKGQANDCVVRAIAIAIGKPYSEVYDAINVIAKTESLTKHKPRKTSAREGVYRSTYQQYLENLGWQWIPTMGIGQGCKVHLKTDELPSGTIIVRLSKHVCAVINGVIHDTDDPSRDGNRCVYGYFIKPELETKQENLMKNKTLTFEQQKVLSYLIKNGPSRGRTGVSFSPKVACNLLKCGWVTREYRHVSRFYYYSITPEGRAAYEAWKAEQDATSEVEPIPTEQPVAPGTMVNPINGSIDTTYYISFYSVAPDGTYFTYDLRDAGGHTVAERVRRDYFAVITKNESPVDPDPKPEPAPIYDFPAFWQMVADWLAMQDDLAESSAEERLTDALAKQYALRSQVAFLTQQVNERSELLAGIYELAHGVIINPDRLLSSALVRIEQLTEDYTVAQDRNQWIQDSIDLGRDEDESEGYIPPRRYQDIRAGMATLLRAAGKESIDDET